MIQVYNTLTREKEAFEPLEKGKIKMYVCGPTVYNYIHIGNARSAVAFDTIRRYFEYRGYEVNYVSNFTDVDDKIIRSAKKLGVTAPEVAEKYIDAYFQDTEALEVQRANEHPRVMENIPEIISFIEALIQKDFAYESDGDVYYRTRKFPDYGKLSRISLDELAVGASNRLEEENTKKEDPLDFALWKQTKADEINWDSPWGKGRPGWHIECSVMATKYLGETIDIHAGGQDLSFPHHENEIAQSEAKTGHPFARYWMHNGFVTMDDEKMSKSIGNVVLVHELVKQVDPQIIRFFMSAAHYRRPINYTEETLEEAKANLSRVRTAFQNASYRLNDAKETLTDDAMELTEWDRLKELFVEKMDDDFNAANGMTVVYDMAKKMNVYSERKEVSQTVLQKIQTDFQKIMSIFGIVLGQEEELLDEEIEALIEERNQARKNRDFQKADTIRDQLKEQGILLEDTPQGIRWKRGEV